MPKIAPIIKISPKNNTKLVKPNSYRITKNPKSIINKPKNNYTRLIKHKAPKKYILKKVPNSVVKISPKNNTKLVKPKYTKVKLHHKHVYHGRVDQSLSSCKKLEQMGYDRITFEARNSACPICQKVNGFTWDLASWLRTLKHSAPVFEITHPNCLDYVRVWDSEGILPAAYVNWTGEIKF